MVMASRDATKLRGTKMETAIQAVIISTLLIILAMGFMVAAMVYQMSGFIVAGTVFGLAGMLIAMSGIKP